MHNVSRDVKAATLEAEGWTYAAIAAELGYADKATAKRACDTVKDELRRDERWASARQARLLELDELRAALWQVVKDPPPLVDRLGRVVHDDDGQVVPDVTAMTNAAGAIIRASERTSRLQGLDAPRKTQMSVDAIIRSIPEGDLKAYVDQQPAELEVKVERELDSWHQRPIAERRQFLQRGLDALDAEERRAGAIPAVAETG
jgi:hypothetical protein